MAAPPSMYYLHTFHRVAVERSFTRAARQLHLSQPAVSAHVRALEQYYGGPLFQVRHRRVYLTAEGEALFAYTDRIFNLLQDAERAVAATRTLERGALVLAASTTIGNYLLPSILRRFAKAHPGVQIDLAIGTTAEIVARILAEQAPLGLVEAPVSDPALEVQAIGEDEMVLIARPEHPWARQGTIQPADLHGALVLRREATSGTQQFVDLVLERAGATMGTAMVLGSTEALAQMVLMDGGVAWVPRIAVARELAAGDLAVVRVADVDPRRSLWSVMLRGVHLPPATAAFRQLVMDLLPLMRQID
jgi:DNA-binding transcriptional LysR family regulator